MLLTQKVPRFSCHHYRLLLTCMTLQAASGLGPDQVTGTETVLRTFPVPASRKLHGTSFLVLAFFLNQVNIYISIFIVGILHPDSGAGGFVFVNSLLERSLS